MAKRDFFVDIDMNDSEIQNAVIHKLSSDPSGVEGQIYFNTVSQRLKIYDDDASSWVELVAGGSTAFSSISSGTNTSATMTVGNGSSLGTTGTGTIDANRFNGNSDVSVSDGGTGVGSFNAYGVIFGGTTSTSALQSVSPSATSGVILRGAGSSSLPSWSTATYPNTVSSGDLLYASSANVIAGLTVTNSSALVSSNLGVPSWVALTDGKIVIGSTGATPVGATLTQGSGITITNGAGSITIAANASGIDHGSLGGLADDDHTQYVIKTPTSTARNTITGSTTSVTPLTLAVPSGIISTTVILDVQGQSSLSYFQVVADSSDNHVLTKVNFYVRGQKAIRLYDSDNSNYVALKATATTTSNYTLTFPAAIGSSHQILKDGDGSGTLEWTNAVFSIAKSDDTNVTMTIGNTNGAYTLTMGWSGTLAISRGGTGASNKTTAFDNLSPLTTDGDLIYYNSSHNVRLGVGSPNQVLTVNISNLPIWANPDHGTFSGLSDDDHTQYIYNAPSSDTRNIIQPSNDSKGLIVRGNASQSKNIFEVQNSGSGSLLTVGYDGDVYISGDLIVDGDTLTVNTSVVTIEDNFVVVNSGGLVRDAGIEVERGLDGSADNARLTFSEGPEDWMVDDGSTVWTMGRKYAETITGDGGTSSFVITHNMKTTDVVVQVFNMAGLKIEPQIINDTSNTVTIGFKTNVGMGTSYRVVVVG